MTGGDRGEEEDEGAGKKRRRQGRRKLKRRRSSDEAKEMSNVFRIFLFLSFVLFDADDNKYDC